MRIIHEMRDLHRATLAEGAGRRGLRDRGVAAKGEKRPREVAFWREAGRGPRKSARRSRKAPKREWSGPEVGDRSPVAHKKRAVFTLKRKLDAQRYEDSLFGLDTDDEEGGETPEKMRRPYAGDESEDPML
jgi:hypothetical protein